MNITDWYGPCGRNKPEGKEIYFKMKNFSCPRIYIHMIDLEIEKNDNFNSRNNYFVSVLIDQMYRDINFFKSINISVFRVFEDKLKEVLENMNIEKIIDTYNFKMRNVKPVYTNLTKSDTLKVFVGLKLPIFIHDFFKLIKKVNGNSNIASYILNAINIDMYIRKGFIDLNNPHINRLKGISRTKSIVRSNLRYTLDFDLINDLAGNLSEI